MATDETTSQEKKPDPYKNIRLIMDIIKPFSFITSLAGDPIVSPLIFLVSANGEWLASKFIDGYEIQWWKKVLVIIGDIIVIIILINAFMLISIAVNCDIRGTFVGAITEDATKSSILGWITEHLSKLVACN